jgi:hypothetical protein
MANKIQAMTDAQRCALRAFAQSTTPDGLGLALWQVQPVRQATIDALCRKGYLMPADGSLSHFVVTKAGLCAPDSDTRG